MQGGLILYILSAYVPGNLEAQKDFLKLDILDKNVVQKNPSFYIVIKFNKPLFLGLLTDH